MTVLPVTSKLELSVAGPLAVNDVMSVAPKTDSASLHVALPVTPKAPVTSKLLFIVATPLTTKSSVVVVPVTPRPPDNVDEPVTPSVPPTVAFSVTSSESLKVAKPVTPRVLSSEATPVTVHEVNVAEEAPTSPIGVELMLPNSIVRSVER